MLQAVGQVGDVPEDLNEDGVVDAKDVSEITGRLECANAPAPPPSPDFNGDGVVGYEDLLILLAFWDQSDPEGYDLNGDGQVDYVDLLVYHNNDDVYCYHCEDVGDDNKDDDDCYYDDVAGNDVGDNYE